MKKKISIIVVIYNQADKIQIRYDQIRSSFQCTHNYIYEIVFINDGSTDHSWAIISAIAFKDKTVKAVNLSRRFGYQNAVKAGFDHSEADAYCILDKNLHYQFQIDHMMQWSESTKRLHDRTFKIPVLIDAQAKEAYLSHLQKKTSVAASFIVSFFLQKKQQPSALIGYGSLIIIATGLFFLGLIGAHIILFKYAISLQVVSIVMLYLLIGVQGIVVWLIQEYGKRINQNESSEPLYTIQEFFTREKLDEIQQKSKQSVSHLSL